MKWHDSVVVASVCLQGCVPFCCLSLSPIVACACFCACCCFCISFCVGGNACPPVLAPPSPPLPRSRRISPPHAAGTHRLCCCDAYSSCHQIASLCHLCPHQVDKARGLAILKAERKVKEQFWTRSASTSPLSVVIPKSVCESRAKTIWPNARTSLYWLTFLFRLNCS